MALCPKHLRRRVLFGETAAADRRSLRMLPPPPFGTLFHAVGGWAVAINLLGLYMIVRHTPAPMRHLRIYLIEQFVVNLAFDFYFTFLMDATPFFPYLAGYSYGPMWTVFGVRAVYQFAILVMIIHLYITTICQLFYVKAVSMMANEPTAKDHWLRRVGHRRISIAFHTVFPVPCCILGFLSAAPRQDIVNYVSSSFSGDVIDLLKIDSIDWVTGGRSRDLILLLAYLSAFSLIIQFGLMLYSIVLIWRLMWASRCHMSVTAYRRARYFVIVLLLQSITPIVCAALPLSLVIVSAIFDCWIFTPSGWRLMFCIVELHGTLGTTLLVLLVPTYRSVLVHWVRNAGRRLSRAPTSTGNATTNWYGPEKQEMAKGLVCCGIPLTPGPSSRVVVVDLPTSWRNRIQTHRLEETRIAVVS